MLRRLAVLMVVLLVFSACAASTPTPAPSPAPTSAAASRVPVSGPSPAGIGRAFIEALSRGDGAAAQGMEDATMLVAAPAAQLGQIWQQFVTQFGAFESIGSVSVTAQAPYTVAVVETTFARAKVALTVTVDGSGQVSGLHVAAVTAPSSRPGSSPAT